MTSYYQRNRVKILAKKKTYKENHIDKVQQSQQKTYKKYKIKKIAIVKKYYDLNKEYLIAKQVQNRSFLRKHNAFFKLKHNIRSLISMVLRKRSFVKESRTASLLGCSFEVFKVHVESYFDQEMNWDNYGVIWTYDHVCPCSQAKSEEELIKLQHYTNLRPSKDNFVKSDNKTPDGEQLCILLLGRTWITKGDIL